MVPRDLASPLSPRRGEAGRGVLPRGGEGRLLLLSGFCAGLAIATRVASALFLVPVGLWLLWLAWPVARRAPRRAAGMLLAWGAPVAGWLAVVAFYDWWRFGSVTETGYGAEAHAYTTPLLTGLAGLLLSPGRGVFWYDPPLLLALGGAWWFARRRPAPALVIAGMTLATLGLYARYYQWHGGGVWGPRFLVPLLPLLLLPAGELVERAWAGRRVALGALALAGVLGLGVTALGIVVPFDRYVAQYSASPAALHDALWEVDDSPIIVEAREVDDTLTRPDVAAARYGSRRLAAIALVAGLVGVAALALAVRDARAVPLLFGRTGRKRSQAPVSGGHGPAMLDGIDLVDTGRPDERAGRPEG